MPVSMIFCSRHCSDSVKMTLIGLDETRLIALQSLVGFFSNHLIYYICGAISETLRGQYMYKNKQMCNFASDILLVYISPHDN